MTSKKEEERCRALESQGKKVKRKKIDKPWTRPSPDNLCQEPELLVLVCEFDYDLLNNAFKEYCHDRGILHVVGETGSKREKYFLDHNKSKSEYLKDPYFRFAQELDGKKYQYTVEEMETGWKTIQLGRAKLQDCWELYSKGLEK